MVRRRRHRVISPGVVRLSLSGSVKAWSARPTTAPRPWVDQRPRPTSHCWTPHARHGRRAGCGGGAQLPGAAYFPRTTSRRSSGHSTGRRGSQLQGFDSLRKLGGARLRGPRRGGALAGRATPGNSPARGTRGPGAQRARAQVLNRVRAVKASPRSQPSYMWRHRR